jgi:hypothetical protein
MTTRGDEMVRDAEAVTAQITTLGQATFSRRNLALLIEPFTSRLEYFLKAVVFPTASRRAGLSQLIDDLPTIGTSQPSVAALHRLRELYNTSKHDPDRDLIWRECVDALNGTAAALGEVAGLGLPPVDARFEQELSAVVYVGLWDHYVGGETEIGLHLPSDHWTGTYPIGTFHMPMQDWDRLKPLLVNHPRFAGGEQGMGSDIWQSFAQEGDFLGGGAWQGDIRELLALLAPFNEATLEHAVIPFLSRRNSLLSTGTALISAAIDIIRGDAALDGETLRTRIADRARTEYAADASTTHGRAILEELVRLIGTLPNLRRAAVAGPVFEKVANGSQIEGVPVRLEGANLVWLIG